MSFRTFTALSLIALSVSATAPQAQTTAPDADRITVQSRVPVEVAIGPERVVVLDSTANDTLRALGIRPVGIQRNGFDAAFREWLDDASIRDVGKERGLDYEAIAELKPDLIITGWRNSVTPELAAIAPVIDVSPRFGKPGHLETLRDNTLLFGKIFRKEAEAAALVARLDDSIARTRTGFEKVGTGLMLVVNEGKISPAAPGSRYGAFYDTLHLTAPVLPEPPPPEPGTEARAGFRQLTPAELAAADPDIVIVFNRSAVFGKPGEYVTAETVFADPVFAETRFVKNGRIVELNPQEMYLAEGLVSYQNALDAVLEKLPQ